MVIVIIIVIYLFLMFKSFGHSTCIHPVKKDQASRLMLLCVCIWKEIEAKQCTRFNILNPLMQKIFSVSKVQIICKSYNDIWPYQIQ